MKKWFSTHRLLFLIMIMAAFFRLYGLNWDQGHHLHPDERFLTMVVGALEWPQSLIDYLNPNVSSLNPYNVGYDFFVYGTFPLYLIKFISEIIAFDHVSYNNITLVGRIISALFDLGVVFLVFRIGRKIFNETAGLFSALFYSLMVLPIQLSHFFAVDTFLIFFLVLSFYFLIGFLSGKDSILNSMFLGFSYGLALASKISAILFLPAILIGFGYKLLNQEPLRKTAVHFLLVFTFSYLTLRFGDPRLFSDASFMNLKLNQQFIANIKQLQFFNNPETSYPPALQWVKTAPIIFPLKNMLLWGLGIPLGLLVILGVFYSLRLAIFELNNIKKKKWNKYLRKIRYKEVGHFTVLIWILLFFFYQGFQFVKSLRYLYPIYPFLALLASYFFYRNFVIRKRWVFSTIILVALFIYPLSFLTIYSRPHARISASEWIYRNIPAGSTISCEYWDDCLPLPEKERSSVLYNVEELHLFDTDTKSKWENVNQQLKKIDFIILSSNRLWGTIPKLPEKYPITSKFYSDLLSEKFHFTKVAEFTSYPTIPFLSWKISDDGADESFTVYDHPKVMIFQRK